MTIERVPKVPFAQIANAALRDKRLSFKARGILAMVLSHAGEWQATAGWIEKQSDRDGEAAIQSGLNELTRLGYRSVTTERNEKGQVNTVVEWSHTPINRPPENPGTGLPARRKTTAPIEHQETEQHLQNTNKQFEDFWREYPRKAAVGAARKAWNAAIKTTTPDVIIDAARAYAQDPNRVAAYTAHPATWLNGERWMDGPLPARGTDLQGIFERARERDT